MLNKFEIECEVRESVKLKISSLCGKISLGKQSSCLNIEAVAATDKGKVRLANEDGYVMNERLGLYFVVDGMGGHKHGTLAAQLVMENMQTKLEKALHQQQPVSASSSQMLLHHVECVLANVNAMLYEANVERGYGEGVGMGAVISGVLLCAAQQQAIIFNIGDSRVYLKRGAQFRRMTTDHTIYELWKAKGQPGVPPPKNFIFRALGPRKDVNADVQVVDCEADDVFLLCSDGLSNMVADAELAQTLATNLSAPGEFSALPRALIEQALVRGGPDNITAMALRL